MIHLTFKKINFILVSGHKKFVPRPFISVYDKDFPNSMLQVCFIPQNTINNEGITSSGQSQHLLQRKLDNFRKSVKFLSQTIRIFQPVRPIWLIFSRERQKMSGLSAYSKHLWSLVTWPQHIDYGSHRWKSTFQHFAKIPKFQKSERKFVLIITVPKTWDTFLYDQ